MQIRRALISVSDKTGIVSFAQSLAEQGVEIISTGGTRRTLEEAEVPVISISDVTGFPEILDGRVKTLHPKVHGGLLAVRDLQTHQQQLQDQAITPIDLVCVNLYPFQQTIAKPDVDFAEAIENIDIGGPSMVRSAAKNHRYVTVVIDPNDYAFVIQQLKENGGTDEALRRRLAAKAFGHTAAYDALIADYLNRQIDEPFPGQLTLTFQKQQELRYGENPHQQAAFYREPLAGEGLLATCEQLQGKELSYNNISDANAALELVREFEQPTVVAVKHMNPCGVGSADTIVEAYRLAYDADPISIYGGIIATNQTVDDETAELMSQIFLEIIIAPEFTEEARQILTKKQNLRLLRLKGEVSTVQQHKVVSVGGGLLIQDVDQHEITREECQNATKRAPSKQEWADLLFAWKVVKHVKSNAIVLVKNGQTIGIGAGQMNRVGAAKIAIEQAGEQAKGAVLASDAFFPMKDTLEVAAAAGIRAIIQPGGSVRDQESIDEANKHDIAMVMTGIRHFKH
ncbi:phosphoribosylaminoimidazolecarboxamide formyltransferase / IMP cyclohydrolase [Seinonella peptonophila]|uniref:Bifunctional purine biosynthesis protein PurH n=1 Tax=Seinonella peptonophila TaxID=112248 RepID=A0A1M4ZHH7_9BACL|nr:bifunctional phosphoribosylaminoimidazolecarboxamide formyltransferase/IMP cyclohydrolase [Seinonella peptonophila]SHF17408.1 phosphoribosylaminoimidazolecarboxamide formyltransferase / IMP cyclohydrolase [Seinonella peptonophila]